MKIAINTLALLKNKAGAEQYTINIINELAKIDKENKFIIIASNINKEIYNVNQNNFSSYVINLNTNFRIPRILYEQLILPFILKKLKINVLFSPCNIMPIFAFCKTVTMIFDMHWFLYSNKLSFLRVFYIKTFIKLSAKRSDKILTLSENSLNDIIKYTNVSKEKIKITPIGHTPLCRLKNSLDEKTWENIKNKYNLEKKYLLFIGQLLFRKNIDSIIKALNLIKEDNNNLDFDFIIIGHKNEAYPLLSRLTVKYKLENHIKFLGELNDIETGYILNNAEVFIYPSLYEGFGIPVLEAMYYNIPVITSNVSSLPYVGGSACFYINPKNIIEIKHAILKLFSDKNLCEQLILKGKEQAQKFTWANSAYITKLVLTIL